MHGRGKSDEAIVAGKPANKVEPSTAEPAEPRAEAEGNADQQSTGSMPSRGRHRVVGRRRDERAIKRERRMKSPALASLSARSRSAARRSARSAAPSGLSFMMAIGKVPIQEEPWTLPAAVDCFSQSDPWRGSLLDGVRSSARSSNDPELRDLIWNARASEPCRRRRSTEAGQTKFHLWIHPAGCIAEPRHSQEPRLIP
jgi:hypothetical protein